MPRILLVEDDASIVASLKEYLLKEGFDVASASGQSEQFVTGYPFIAAPITSYTIHMNAENLNGFVGSGEAKGTEACF